MKPRPNAGKSPKKRAFPKWCPKPSSCVDAVINVVESPGSYVAEKSLAGDLGVAPAPVSHSVDAGPGIQLPVLDFEPGSSDAVGMGLHMRLQLGSLPLPVPPECKLNLPAVDFQVSRPQLQHVDQTCSLGGFPAVVVDSNSSFSNSNGPNESHLEGPGCNAGENRDIESDPDDTNSRSSEEWICFEVIAKDPMQYALRCLLERMLLCTLTPSPRINVVFCLISLIHVGPMCLSPPDLGSSVQTSPPDHWPAVLDSCVVNDPLSPPGPPRIPDPHCEACSENSLETSKLKEVNDSLSSVTGFKSSGNPAILCRAKSGEVSQLGSKCAPDSDPLDIVLCAKDQTGVDLGLDLHLNVDSPMSDSVNSVNLVDAESAPELTVPSVGCNAQFHCLPIGPSYAEILCRGIDADPPGVLVGGESSLAIFKEDRLAALGTGVCPFKLDPHPPDVAVPKLESALPLLPPVSEQASGPVAYPPGPHDLAVDLVTPPSISRIITKYSLDTSYHLGHGSCSPNGLSAASSTDSHLDTPEVSYLGPKAAPSQQDSWQPVKSPDVEGQALALCWRLIGEWLCQGQCSSLCGIDAVWSLTSNHDGLQ
ncbi:hypothetical protein Nepgr_021696 [Nepenthes gracilis]|uniref:Uncharacterized protein n=1 Tax=Nepenthes gracilis TaxID=150966 RepID=A0AAD3SZ84_NEPGR|nr:hypothetical protein Nepgr_021696 [Nepenthes gracilis]